VITAVPMRYRGTTFRSTLEADWACTLDALGVAWEYESLLVETSVGPYLPDFYFPDHGIWAEVKGPHGERLNKWEAFIETLPEYRPDDVDRSRGIAPPKPAMLLLPSRRGFAVWDTSGGFEFNWNLGVASHHDAYWHNPDASCFCPYPCPGGDLCLLSVKGGSYLSCTHNEHQPRKGAYWGVNYSGEDDLIGQLDLSSCLPFLRARDYGGAPVWSGDDAISRSKGSRS